MTKTDESQTGEKSKAAVNIKPLSSISNPPWFEGSEDDSEDDEWFYNSIHNYEQMCIYSIICRPAAIDIDVESRRLVIAGARSSMRKPDKTDRRKFEIAVYSIPEKLVIYGNKEKEGLLSGRDLSLLAGVALDEFVKNINFVKHERLAVVHKNKVTLWNINIESDLLVNLKTISVEPGFLLKHVIVPDSNNLLISYTSPAGWGILQMNLTCNSEQPNNPDIPETKIVELHGISKFKIVRIEQLNNSVISIVAVDTPTPTSSTKAHRLFFEPTIQDGILDGLQYLGKVENFESSHLCNQPNYASSYQESVFERFCWAKTNEVEKEVLGAQLCVESKIEDSGIYKKVSLIIHRHQCIGEEASNCPEFSQKTNVDDESISMIQEDINAVRSFSMNAAFVPWKNETSDHKVSEDSTGQNHSLVHSRNLVITSITNIYVYKILLLQSQSNKSKKPKLDSDWIIDCQFLFCHDGHKSDIRHVLPYSSRLPNLFFSVEYDKLHAWKWQQSQEVKKKGE